jgi:hypothetical protein
MKKSYLPGICLLVLVALLLWHSYDDGKPPNTTTPAPGPVSSDDGPPLPAVPQVAGGLQLTSFYSGDAAMRDIVRLHSNEFPLSEALIARYESEGSEATIWVSVSPDESEAALLMEAMVIKMPDSPVFTEKDPFEAAGKTIYVVTGMGMEHYYWQDGIYVWWLGVDAEDPKAVLDALLTD